MIDFLIGVGSVLSVLLLAAQVRERGRPDLLWSRLWFAIALSLGAFWGLTRSIQLERHPIEIGVAGLALGLAFLVRRRAVAVTREE